MKRNSICVLFVSFVLMLLAGCSNDTDLSGNQDLNLNVPETTPTSRVVSMDQIQAYANKTFVAIQDKETGMDTRSSASANSVKIVPILRDNGDPVLYAVNFGDDEGFMLLSADKESANTMIAFNTSGKLDLYEMDPNSPMGLMIEEQKAKISSDIDEGIHYDTQSYEMWEYLGAISDVEIEIEMIIDIDETAKTRGTHKGSWGLTQIGPWSTVSGCTWGQANGYNADSPIPNYHLAGCPAVAIGLLCKVWRYPSKYDYSNMPNSLPNTTQSNAISKMFRDIANNIPGYSWGVNASGALETPIVTGLKSLGYSSAKSDAYNFNTVYNNINNWYPVLLGGFSGNNGHIWIADGYAEIKWKVTKKFLGITIDSWYEYSDNFYMNWGWYGTSNGWVDQASWPTYNGNRRMWYDLMPK